MPNLLNGKINYEYNGTIVSGTVPLVGTVATSTCNNGYVLSGGSGSNNTCLTSGNWASNPTCKPGNKMS